MKLEVKYIPTSELKAYKNNAKIHTAEQVEQIKKSIQEFGFNDPIAIWKDKTIIEGHGRLMASIELGIESVPTIDLSFLTDEERKAYAIVHNKLTMNTGFDLDVLHEELKEMLNINMSDYGFDNLNELDVGSFYIDEPEKEDQEENENRTQCPHCHNWFEV